MLISESRLRTGWYAGKINEGAKLRKKGKKHIKGESAKTPWSSVATPGNPLLPNGSQKGKRKVSEKEKGADGQKKAREPHVEEYRMNEALANLGKKTWTDLKKGERDEKEAETDKKTGED